MNRMEELPKDIIFLIACLLSIPCVGRFKRVSKKINQLLSCDEFYKMQTKVCFSKVIQQAKDKDIYWNEFSVFEIMRWCFEYTRVFSSFEGNTKEPIVYTRNDLDSLKEVFTMNDFISPESTFFGYTRKMMRLNNGIQNQGGECNFFAIREKGKKRSEKVFLDENVIDNHATQNGFNFFRATNGKIYSMNEVRKLQRMTVSKKQDFQKYFDLYIKWEKNYENQKTKSQIFIFKSIYVEETKEWLCVLNIPLREKVTTISAPISHILDSKIYNVVPIVDYCDIVFSSSDTNPIRLIETWEFFSKNFPKEYETCKDLAQHNVDLAKQELLSEK